MRVLVTGATGFIAGHLIPALAHAGHDVISAGHDPSRLAAGTSALEIDLAAASWPALPDVDAIVHLAQANAPFPDGADALFAVNAAATQRLLEHLRRCGGSHFVLASSGSVYGMSDETLTESSPLAARDFYAATKVAAERITEAYAQHCATSVLRLFVPYGPGQVNRMLPRLADRVRAGETIQLNQAGRPRMNPVYVGDVCLVVQQALESGTGTGVVNVAGDDVTDIRGVTELMGEILGVDVAFQQGAGVAGDIVADNAALHAYLGGTALVSLRDGLERMLRAQPTVI